MQRLFGYSTWQEYKQDNFEDLTRTTKRDSQGNVSSAATVHPFHVAYAYEEFINNFNPEDYELVGVPKNNAGGIKPSDATLISLVSGLRKGFFGSSTGADELSNTGVLNAAIYNPKEGLLNKKIIDKIKEKSNVSEKIKQVFTRAMFVHHPNNGFWRLDLKDPFMTDKRSEALNVRPTESTSDLAILNELRTGRTPHVHIENSLDGLYEGFWGGLGRLTKPLWSPLVKGVKHGWKSLTRPATNTWRSRGALPAGAPGPVRQFTRPGYRAAAERARRVSKLRWAGMTQIEKSKHIAAVVYAPLKDVVAGAVEAGLSWPAFLGWFTYESYIKPGHAEWISEWITKWGEEKGYWDRDDPDLLESIEDRVSNLSEEDRKDLIMSLPSEQGSANIESVSDMNFFLLPKTWKSGGFLTKAEEVLAKRVGANYSSGLMIGPTGQPVLLNFKKAFAKGTKVKGSAAMQQPIKQKTPSATVTPSSVLVFGHSQAKRFEKPLAMASKVAGIEVTKIVKSGKSDNGLQKLVSEIPKKNYSHAYLFLGGNTGAAGPDYEGPKAGIINHMVGVLKIPKQNIVVILPPVNLDNKYSKSRIPLNKRAEGIFNSLGVSVLPQVTGNAGDFSGDGYHIKSSSPLTTAAAANLLTSFTASPDMPTAPSERSITTPGSKADVAQIVADEARKARVDPLFALTVARIESNFNPLSNMNKKSRYKGLYQFGSHYKEEWQTKYGLDWSRVHDTRHAAAAFMNAIKYFVNTLRSRGIVKNSTASNVDPNEAYLIYLAWQQGISGTTQIIKAAGQGASVPNNIQRNMDNNTYPKTPNISPGDFLEMWSRKTKGFMSGVRGKYARALAGSQPQISESLDYIFQEISNVIKEVRI